MSKIYLFLKSNRKILALIFLLISCFGLVFFIIFSPKLRTKVVFLKQYFLPNFPTGFDVARANEGEFLTSKDGSDAFTFIKHYRIEDWSEARSILQTKDGGYVFTGHGNYDKKGVLSDIDAFISKVDTKGNPLWTKIFQSFHSVGIDKGVGGFAKKGDEYGRDIVELADGSFLMASQGTGFVDRQYLKKKERWDDVFLIKFDKNGKHLWTKMIGDYSTDRVYKVFATKDNGFLFSGYFTQTGFGEKTAPSYFVVAKFDKNGKKTWSQKIEMSSADIEPLSDGSFVAVGSVKTAVAENTALPVMIKFNANFGIEWTKSLEIVPLEESVYTVDEEGHTHMKYITKRSSAGNFFAIKQTADGYVALGFLSPILTGGSVWSTPAGKFSLSAVKISNSGDLEWAKAIKVGMQFGGQFNNDVSGTKIIKTNDNGFVFKLDYLPLPRSDQENRADVVDEKLEQLNALCESKGRAEDCDNGKITDDPELLLAWEDYVKTAKSFDTSLNNGALLVKTDADFNPQWSKKIALEDYVYGYDIAPTLDNGLIISGSYNTSILSYSTAMGQGYFVDTLLVKLDANGDVANNQGMISDYTDLSAKDVGSFLVLNNFSPVVKSLTLKIDKKVQPKTPVFKTKVIDICPVAVNTAEAVVFSGLSTGIPSQIQPKTASWAEINYASTPDTEEIKPIYKTAVEVHQELLPILNQTFANEVKLKKDVFGGLEYVFGRLVIESDKTAVQSYLEGRGYKTYLAEGDQLVMMKIGRTLTITFSFYDKTKGTLYVTY